MPQPQQGWVCDLYHNSWQHQILKPLSKVKDRTLILMDTRWALYRWATLGNSCIFSLNSNTFQIKVKIVFLIWLCGKTGPWLLCRVHDEVEPSWQEPPGDGSMRLNLWFVASVPPHPTCPRHHSSLSYRNIMQTNESVFSSSEISLSHTINVRNNPMLNKSNLFQH